ncbi:hypothetical protein O7626_14390 [Micromonospora sp. WMMD1102]|uniref:hypothetical protein n=1 Tax=Micromonospora sp. WMMD1102 TaxID=3016105 RepID=UPI0024154FBF|nr:hypothetical protein [Micromonospora sp. WMMD1102]MDG4787103.1 hypothetical protein [Micromonospora sp. WMMD1102]
MNTLFNIPPPTGQSDLLDLLTPAPTYSCNGCGRTLPEPPTMWNNRCGRCHRGTPDRQPTPCKHCGPLTGTPDPCCQRSLATAEEPYVEQARTSANPATVAHPTEITTTGRWQQQFPEFYTTTPTADLIDIHATAVRDAHDLARRVPDVEPDPHSTDPAKVWAHNAGHHITRCNHLAAVVADVATERDIHLPNPPTSQ